MWGVRKNDVLFERQSQTSPPRTKWRGKSFESILLKPIWEIFDRLPGRFEFFHCNIDQPNFNAEKCPDQTFENVYFYEIVPRNHTALELLAVLQYRFTMLFYWVPFLHNTKLLKTKTS